MKTIFKGSLAALLVMFVVLASCSKQGSNDAQVGLPDVSDFRIAKALPFSAGSSSTVSIYSNSLGSATFKVHYDLTGSNTLLSQTSTLVMKGGAGVFVTPKMPNAGLTFLTINSITNSKGGGTVLLENNKYTISDSTGLLSAIIDSTYNFYATDLVATLDSNHLTIRGVIAEPNTSTITLYIDNFKRSNGSIYFSNYDVPEIAHAMYTFPGGGFLSANGVIKIITVSPTLSGSFSFTGMDSTTVTSGLFAVPTPE